MKKKLKWIGTGALSLLAIYLYGKSSSQKGELSSLKKDNEFLKMESKRLHRELNSRNYHLGKLRNELDSELRKTV